MNVLTIELCAEDRARLDKIIEGLARIEGHPDCSACVAGVASVMDKACDAIDAAKDAAPAVVPAPVSEPPVDAAAPAEPAKPSVTLAQIQRKAAQIAASSDLKKDKLRALISAYADRVSAIPESAWDEVWSKLGALESEA